MRAKAYKDYEEEIVYKDSKMIGRFKEFFKDGDWAIKSYPRNGILNITHKHKNGTTYIIPFRYCVTRNKGHDTSVCDYGCHVCHEKAPESVVVVWKLLNWEAPWE